MTDFSLLPPVFAQVLLTFILIFWMAWERFVAVREGKVVQGAPGTRPIWTGRAAQVSNAYHNQLEIPILFYAVAAFATMAGATGWPMTGLAWAFVGFRSLQAAIHSTYNTVAHRFLAFLASVVVLAAMWVLLALNTQWSV